MPFGPRVRPAQLSGPLAKSAAFGPSIVTAPRVKVAVLLGLVMVIVCGALGGVVYELMTLRGRLEMPHRADDVAADEDLSGAVAR